MGVRRGTAVAALLEVVTPLLAVLSVLVFVLLLVLYVGDEVWRRRHAPDNVYLRIYSHQAIVLKVALIAVTLLLYDAHPPVQTTAVLVVLLLLALHRLRGRNKIVRLRAVGS